MTNDTKPQNEQEELQKMVFQLNVYKKQIEDTASQMRLLEVSTSEVSSTLSTLKALKETKAGADVLISIGSGSFVRAKLTDTTNLVLGMGAGISVEKTIEEAEENLNKRTEAMSKALAKMRTNYMELDARITELNEKAENIVQRIQQKRM